MCDNHCAITVRRGADGRAVGLEAFGGHPWNRGCICSKAHGIVDITNHPDRLTKPLKKTEGGWQEIGLEQALDEIAARIRGIQERHGPESMAVWKGEATRFNQQENLAKRFCRALGTPNYVSVDSLCFASRLMAFSTVYGCWPKADMENARCIFVWGSNPPTSHPPLTRMILDARDAGAKLVVVDPRLSMMARAADLHIMPRPGTDGALAWGLIHLLIESGRQDRAFIQDHTIGFEKVAAYARDFTPDKVEAETGVAAADLRRAAALMLGALPRVAQYVGNAIEHYDNGFESTRAISYLFALCGAFDVRGGGLDAEPLGERSLALFDEIPLDHLKAVAQDRFPVLFDYRHEANTMSVFDAVLTGDPYPIKGMILTAGNPVLTNPNAGKVERALKALDLLVVREVFMSDCAGLADYVLPAATSLERTELFYHALIQTVSLSNRIAELPGVQDEYGFWRAMAQRLGFAEHFPWADESELNAWLLEPTGIGLEDLARRPEGIQLKPIRYEKWRDRPLSTPSGKVEFASAYLHDLRYSEIAEYRPPYHLRQSQDDYPFALITGARRTLSYHSSYKRLPRFQAGAEGAYMEMHPGDAARLGVGDGETVAVTSAIGGIEIPVKVVAANEILPGVLQATDGWPEANVNILTHDDVLGPIDGYPTLKGVPVRVGKRR
jgi:anaerobic selenocysteine-containing dehydrogenase